VYSGAVVCIPIADNPSEIPINPDSSWEESTRLTYATWASRVSKKNSPSKGHIFEKLPIGIGSRISLKNIKVQKCAFNTKNKDLYFPHTL
jgi:hypothetical protein